MSVVKSGLLGIFGILLAILVVAVLVVGGCDVQTVGGPAKWANGQVVLTGEPTVKVAGQTP